MHIITACDTIVDTVDDMAWKQRGGQYWDGLLNTLEGVLATFTAELGTYRPCCCTWLLRVESEAQQFSIFSARVVASAVDHRGAESGAGGAVVVW